MKEKYLGTDGKKREMPNIGKLLAVWDRHPEAETKEKEKINTMFEKYVVSGKHKEMGLTTCGIFEETVKRLKERVNTIKTIYKTRKGKNPEMDKEDERQIDCLKWVLKRLNRRIRKIKISEDN